MTKTPQQSVPKALRRPRLFPKPLGSFLPRITRNAFAKYGFATTTLLTDWEAIAGPEFAQSTQPERLKWPRRPDADTEPDDTNRRRTRATLILRVDPSRALDAEYGATRLKERINSYFGYDAISDIRILQAPVAPEATAEPVRKTANDDDPRQTRPQKPPSAAVQQIHDAPLRDALARLESSIATDKDQL